MTQSRRDPNNSPYGEEIAATYREYQALCRSGQVEFSDEGIKQYQLDHVSKECREYLEQYAREYKERTKNRKSYRG